MKKLKVSIGFVLASLLLLLAACGGGSDESSGGGESDEKTVIDFWVFGATNYEELAEKYNEENDDVEVKVKVSENADHHNSLFTALSAGSGAPDLAMLEIDQLDRFKAAQDRFVNLYDLGAEDIQGDYLDWKWEMGETPDGDFLLGLPTDIGPKAMYYRTDIFEEAGLPTDPAEVDELMSTVDAFKEAGIQIKEETGKPMLDSMEMAYRAVMDGLEESYFDTEGNLLITEPDNGVKEAYDFAVEMNDLGLVANYTMWSTEWANAVNEGDFAVEMGAAWLKGWMAGNAPDASGQWRVATLPTEFAGNWGGSYIAIPNETENQEAVYDFASWLVSPENQLASFTSEAGLFPSAPEVYEMDEFKNDTDEYFGGQSTSQYFAQAAEDIPAVYKGSDYVSVNDEILTALTNVYEGADPEEEWNAAVERIETLLSR